MNRFMLIIAFFCMLNSSFIIYSVSRIETKPRTYHHTVEITSAQPQPVDPPTIPEHELLCLQKNMYFEARNQGIKGMVGVAWVTFNRVTNTRFRDTICDVVQRAKFDSRGNPIRNQCQFSWYCDGLKDVPDLNNRIEREAWILSGDIARIMILSCMMNYHTEQCPDDPTNGSLFYHSDKVKPDWKYTKTVKIDAHQYYTLNGE